MLVDRRNLSTPEMPSIRCLGERRLLRVDRYCHLLLMAQGRRGVGVREASKALGVKVERVWEDSRFLDGAGFLVIDESNRLRTVGNPTREEVEVPYLEKVEQYQNRRKAIQAWNGQNKTGGKVHEGIRTGIREGIKTDTFCQEF